MSSAIRFEGGTGGVDVRLVRYAPNSRMDFHSHEEPGVSVVLDGGLLEETTQRSVAATAGWTVVKPAGTSHANRFGPTPVTLLALTFHGCCDDEIQTRWRWLDQPAAYRAVLDLDGDGDLDIVTNEFNAGPQVLVSDLAQRGAVRFLKVRLRGTRSNRNGFGAQAAVVLPDERRIVKVHDGKSGYLSQSDLPLFFGLGDAAAASAIEIRWPSGHLQIIDGPIDAGQTIEVVEQ